MGTNGIQARFRNRDDVLPASRIKLIETQQVGSLTSHLQVKEFNQLNDSFMGDGSKIFARFVFMVRFGDKHSGQMKGWTTAFRSWRHVTLK